MYKVWSGKNNSVRGFIATDKQDETKLSLYGLFPKKGKLGFTTHQEMELISEYPSGGGVKKGKLKFVDVAEIVNWLLSEGVNSRLIRTIRDEIEAEYDFSEEESS
ncbi:hypothetical protein HY503_00910 [Candidatus Woesebacteria bacterium]|nr:hypothetical protein [Candidatus Woesebacteria bacterium]